MRPPTRIRLMGEKIEVHRAKRIDISASHGIGAEACGVYEGDYSRIVLSDDQSISRLRRTFLHEVLHALLDVTDLRNQIEEGLPEEEVVARLTAPMLAFIRENPRAIRYLQEAG